MKKPNQTIDQGEQVDVHLEDADYGVLIMQGRNKVLIETEFIPEFIEKTLLFIEKTESLPAISLQDRVGKWLSDCFGDAIAYSQIERCYRFFEEAGELVQSLGMPEEKAIDLIKYVYGRSKGEPFQEVGGVMITLAALCHAANLDMVQDGEKEFNRINLPEVIEKIRRKHNDKKLRIPDSALPGKDRTETEKGNG